VPFKTSLDFSTWARRIGVKGSGREPLMADEVQPVQVVQDVSGRVPVLLPPSAQAGGSRGAIAVVFSAIEFASRGGGGALVELNFTAGGGQTVVTLDFVQALANVNLPTVFQLSVGQTTQSVLRFGTYAAIPSAATTGTINVGANIIQQITIFVPDGSLFQVVNRTANQNLFGWAQWQEFPPPRAE